MSKETGTKINKLLRKWPPGAVYATSWLGNHGINGDLLVRYRKSQWLEEIGHGAVARKGDPVDWTGGLYAIQRQLGLDVHAGGRTALELAGFAHTLRMGKRRVSLFGSYQVKLPAWFRSRDWGARVEYYMTNLFPAGSRLGQTERPVGRYSILVSTPERAILEALYLVPQALDAEEAGHLVEGLATLRPALVQRLLRACQSVKAKRLLMALAENASHPWVNRVNTRQVDFGKGKRVVVPGGRLHPKYLVTLP
jgi:hypothetical protein